MGVRFCAGIGNAVTSTGLAGGGPGVGEGGGCVLWDLNLSQT